MEETPFVPFKILIAHIQVLLVEVDECSFLLYSNNFFKNVNFSRRGIFYANYFQFIIKSLNAMFVERYFSKLQFEGGVLSDT